MGIVLLEQRYPFQRMLTLRLKRESKNKAIAVLRLHKFKEEESKTIAKVKLPENFFNKKGKSAWHHLKAELLPAGNSITVLSSDDDEGAEPERLAGARIRIELDKQTIIDKKFTGLPLAGRTGLDASGKAKFRFGQVSVLNSDALKLEKSSAGKSKQKSKKLESRKRVGKKVGTPSVGPSKEVGLRKPQTAR